ncbi:MAG: SMC-Scp complex subunit ScpB [bacterium]
MIEEIKTNENINKLAAIECLLFMADRPLPAAEIAVILDISPPAVRQLVDELAGRYLGLQIVEVAGGYELITSKEYFQFINQLHKQPKFKLSPAALETLAIIAYRQPITKPEVEQLRGVNSDSVVSTLLDHELICERGHKHAPGKPMMYGTTDNFLKLYNLTSLSSLPDINTFIENKPPTLEGFKEDNDE